MRLAGVAAITAAVVVTCSACGGTARQSQTVSHPAGSGFRGFAIRPPAKAPTFTLRDQSGRLTGPQNLRGHWFVVAFLYTHCPDVCPLIAENLGLAQQNLPNLDVLAVSVDPSGDTHAAVERFLRLHRLGPRFRYLTGTRAELAPVWAAYHVASTGGPKGTVSHSAFELLVDPSGRERLLYDAQLKAADLEHDLPKLGA